MLVSIRDNGMGISAENLKRVFHHGFTTKGGGRGFGLHISALAAREVGGALTVVSDGPGHGAVFTLELPTAPNALTSSPSQAGSKSPPLSAPAQGTESTKTLAAAS